MPAQVPTIFLGSSSEEKQLAELFVLSLSSAADVVPWWIAPEFSEESTTLDALVAAATDYDFGVFLLTPDDQIVKRDNVGFTARDIVLFEFGLFLAELGPTRTIAFAEVSDAGTPDLPTDLLGVRIPRFETRANRNSRATVNTAVTPILEVIRREGVRKLDIRLAREWGPVRTGEPVVIARIFPEELKEYGRFLRGKMIVLAVRRDDPSRSYTADDELWIDSREFTNTNEEIRLSVNVPAERGANYALHILLVPSGADVSQVSTIGGFLEAGARELKYIPKAWFE